MFEALHSVDHKKNYSSKRAGTTMYKNLFGRVLVLRRTDMVLTFLKVLSAFLTLRQVLRWKYSLVHCYGYELYY